jgi:hypothetical protein
MILFSYEGERGGFFKTYMYSQDELDFIDNEVKLEYEYDQRQAIDNPNYCFYQKESIQDLYTNGLVERWITFCCGGDRDFAGLIMDKNELSEDDLVVWKSSLITGEPIASPKCFSIQDKDTIQKEITELTRDGTSYVRYGRFGKSVLNTPSTLGLDGTESSEASKTAFGADITTTNEDSLKNAYAVVFVIKK